MAIDDRLDEALDIALGFTGQTTQESRQLAFEYLTQFKTVSFALNLLQNSRNEKQLWFAASTLEEQVRSRPDLDCSSIVHMLWNYVLETTNSTPNYVMAKLRMALVYCVFRQKSLSDFCKNILHQAHIPRSSLILQQPLLELVHALCEEMATSQGGFKSSFLALSSDHLNRQLEFNSQIQLLLNMSLMVLKDVTRMTEPITASIDVIAAIAIRITGHLVSFDIKNPLVIKECIEMIGHFATNRIHIEDASRFSLVASSTAACDTLMVILGKKWSHDINVVIVESTLTVLLDLLSRISDTTVNYVGDEYMDKISALVEAFLIPHLRHLHHSRYEGTLGTLLGYVVALTKCQPHVSGIVHCITVWEVFVTHVEDAEESGSQSQEILNSYEKGLVGVMQHLVERMLFASNRSQLEELDDEPQDRNKESNESIPELFGEGYRVTATGALQDQDQEVAEFSDLRSFVLDCFTLVRRIARLPGCAQHLLSHILPAVQSAYQRITQIHTNPSTDRESELQEIHDMTVNCALLSCVSAQHCTNSDVESDKSASWDILVMFIQLAEYIVVNRLHTCGARFVDLECEVLACVRLCSSCVPYVYQNGGSEPLKMAGESMVRIILTTMDTSIVPSPQNVIQSALNLLACIGSIFPYSLQEEIPSMFQLQSSVQQFSLHLPATIQGNLYQALSNSILSAESNESSYSTFIRPVLTSLIETTLTMDKNPSRFLDLSIQLIRDVSICRCLANSIGNQSKNIKIIFYKHIETILPFLLKILNNYFYQNNLIRFNGIDSINELIGFYSDLFHVIRKELPFDIVIQIVTTMVDIFQQPQLIKKLEGLGSSGTAVLCHFLKMLRILVGDNSSRTTNMLPSILNLCFSTLQQVIFSSEHYDTVAPFFVALLEEILENHYRYFITTQIMDEHGNRPRVFSNEIAGRYFICILQAIGTMLQQDSIALPLCKQIIGTFERIETSHKIFTLIDFQQQVRMAFMGIVLGLLTNDRVNLLHDELSLLLFHLAQVDMESFYSICLPQFAQDKCSQCMSNWTGQVDEPTFHRELNYFLNDWKVIGQRNK